MGHVADIGPEPPLPTVPQVWVQNIHRRIVGVNVLRSQHSLDHQVVQGSDEFCHFLAGRCTYTHESGEVIEVEPNTVAFFPADWKGTCRVHETVRKVYMIR